MAALNDVGSGNSPCESQSRDNFGNALLEEEFCVFASSWREQPERVAGKWVEVTRRGSKIITFLALQLGDKPVSRGTPRGVAQVTQLSLLLAAVGDDRTALADLSFLASPAAHHGRASH